MSKYPISKHEICGKDFIHKKITNLPELCDNDIINIEHIRSLLALRDDRKYRKNYHVHQTRYWLYQHIDGVQKLRVRIVKI